MMAMINNHGVVESPTCNDIMLWAATAHWDMDGKAMMVNAWHKMGYSWFDDDEPTSDLVQAAIDHFDDLEDLEVMQEELDDMLEEEGMTVNIRAMMEEMHVPGILMGNHDEDEHAEM